MKKRLLVTVFVSVLLGVFGGSFASYLTQSFKANPNKVIPLVQLNQPILLSEREASYPKKETLGEEIIYSEKSDPTPSPTPEVTVMPVVNYFEATPAAQVGLGMELSSPTPTATPGVEAGLNAEVIFNLINQKRVDAGLTALEKDSRVCEVVASRAPELYSELTGGRMHAGFYNRNLPYRAAENVIYMRTEEQAVSWWMNSAVHRYQLMGDFKYSCVACAGNSCSQIFTNFDPK